MPRFAVARAGAAVMAGAWITRFGNGPMVDVAWITAYRAARLWIAFEWRLVRWPRFGRRAGAGAGEMA